jgi:hypothetical protein
LIVAGAVCQSADQNLPTPIHASDITGKIPALDIGDPRSTRHYYAFTGTPGDLTVTMESNNLNGDLDIFTAVTFRPLMKLPMYAESGSATTKSIYLRAQQVLILRIEARSPNDSDGTYHIAFSGAFAPFSGGIQVAESNESSGEGKSVARSSDKHLRRVSSVGATIDEPVPAPTPSVGAETAKSETKTDTTAKPAGAAPKSSTSDKSRAATPKSTTKRTATRNRQPARKPPAATTPTLTKADTGSSSNTSAPSSKPAAPGGANSSKPNNKPAASPASNSTKQESALPQVPAGGHLIIEEKDGTRIDQPMATVRRVLIENGLIVVMLKNGKIERVPMSNVARMAIEP